MRGVKRHERHDERRGGVAAEKSVALGKHHARARLRRAERRAQSRGAAAYHEHIGVGSEQRASRRELDARRVLRPL